MHEQICSQQELDGVKMILYVEHTVDANDLPIALWRFCNNLDPKRDYHIRKRPTNNRQPTTSNYAACIGFDGTRKTKEFDDFHRDWPNIIERLLVAPDRVVGGICGNACAHPSLSAWLQGMSSIVETRIVFGLDGFRRSGQRL